MKIFSADDRFSKVRFVLEVTLVIVSVRYEKDEVKEFSSVPVNNSLNLSLRDIKKDITYT